MGGYVLPRQTPQRLRVLRAEIVSSMPRRRGTKRPHAGAGGAPGKQGKKPRSTETTLCATSTLEEVQGLSKEQLSAELARRSLMVGGSAADRVQRLHAALSMAPEDIPVKWLNKLARRALAQGKSRQSATAAAAAVAAANSARDVFTVAFKVPATALPTVQTSRGQLLLDEARQVVLFDGAADGLHWAVGRLGAGGEELPSGHAVQWYTPTTAPGARAEHLAELQSGIPTLVMPADGQLEVPEGSGTPRVDASALAHAFPVDAMDHCETPPEAYQHVKPWLVALAAQLGVADPAALQLYDPYFCAGAVRRRLARVGFPHVHNANEDFYAVAEKGAVPAHDVLVTNPPYSGDHPQRLLQYLRSSDKPWAALMPAYVADKAYYLAPSEPKTSGMLYIIPTRRYAYWTPRGLAPPKRGHTGTRGERTSPFASFWYCWAPDHMRSALKQALVAAAGADFKVQDAPPALPAGAGAP